MNMTRIGKDLERMELSLKSLISLWKTRPKKQSENTRKVLSSYVLVVTCSNLWKKF